MLALKIDTALWILLLGVWFIAAPFSRKTVRRESLGSRLRYMVPAIAAGFVMSRPRIGIDFLDAHWSPAVPWVGVLSVALTALGIGFALWARFTLGRNWSGSVTLKQDHELIRTGPYALARHPIYTGFLTAFFGTALARGTAHSFLGLLVIALAFILKLRTEERLMQEQFGNDYVKYRQRVRALIPGVW
jgi:protein-S-isoprenylcysteine O-methyltransferase Ste14